MKKRVLITGGGGLVASTLIRKAPEVFDVHATIHENKTIVDGYVVPFHPVDIRKEQEVKKILSNIKPDIIIHTAAKGSPDYCEKHPEDAQNTNVLGTRYVLESAKEIQAQVFVFSSNQVFSGTNPPYNELSPVGPINVYGQTKKQNEQDAQSYPNAFIVRPMTMYGWANPKGQQNLANTIVRSLRAGSPMNITQDMFNNYLYVGQMADMMWELVEMKDPPKIIHIAGNEKASLSGFALHVAEVFGLPLRLIQPVPKSFFKEESARPMDTTYDISLLRRTFHTKPLDLISGLRRMKQAEHDTQWKTLS